MPESCRILHYLCRQKTNKNMEIKQLYDIFRRSAGVNTDSRTVQPGQLFVALKGENFDGNAYALQALEAGAVAAVVTVFVVYQFITADLQPFIYFQF